MIKPLPVRLLCIFLALLMNAPYEFAQQAPAVPSATPVTPAAPVNPPPQPSNQASGPLTIVILEGNQAINSLPLLKTVAPVVEVRDRNDFPVEGATVVFTLPDHGPGGTFLGGGVSFTTRSDSRGQASVPAIVPRISGKFEIGVSATLGARKGEAAIMQTNSTRARFGPVEPVQRRWYKNKWVWIAAGGAAAIVVTVILVEGSGKTITVTPGAPVFQ